MKFPYNKDISAAIIASTVSEEQQKSMLDIANDLPSEYTNLMAKLRDVPTEQVHIYTSMLKGDVRPFIELIDSVKDGWFNPGDIILMAGNSPSSKALVASQKSIYVNVKSSHVALIYSDFVCLDAMPNEGVTPRLITDVLKDAQDGWRIMRKKGLNSSEVTSLSKASTFYIAQEYKIFLIRENKQSKSKSYCSELARKIYQRARIADTGFPPSGLIAPAHFDKLMDMTSEWEDVTDVLKPVVDLIFEYETIFNIAFEQLRNGLMLNRDRFAERADLRKEVKNKLKKKKISKEMAQKHLSSLDELDSQMNNKFWDFSS